MIRTYRNHRLQTKKRHRKEEPPQDIRKTTYLENKESPIICYKYNKPIRSTAFNHNNFVTELDIENSNPVSWDCKDSKNCYQPAGHIVTGDLKIITDSRIRSILCKGPKYKFPVPIDFKSCREEITGALQEFCNHWYK